MKKLLRDKIDALPTLDQVINKDLADPEFAAAYSQANLRIALARATKIAREKAGLTQEQLADEVGVHQAQIGRLESLKNKSLPGIDLLAKISAATQKTVEVIFPGVHIKIAAEELLGDFIKNPKVKGSANRGAFTPARRAYKTGTMRATSKKGYPSSRRSSKVSPGDPKPKTR